MSRWRTRRTVEAVTEGQWRINDADRDQALERLRTGYVDGRITRDELESRMTTLLRP